MKNYYRSLGVKYREFFSDRYLTLSLIFGIILFAISLVINFYAAIYATDKASNFVNDIILNNTPVVDLDFIFVYGPVLLWVFVAYLCVNNPKRVPFVLKNIALFILIRSVFISLTHIGPFPDRVSINYSVDMIKLFTSGGDLFFSAHTGLPFLMALVFWRNMFLRVIFIVSSIFFGVVVLLSHLHYSIDVMSAFFITYTIFHIAKTFFKRDHRMFLSTEST